MHALAVMRLTREMLTLQIACISCDNMCTNYDSATNCKSSLSPNTELRIVPAMKHHTDSVSNSTMSMYNTVPVDF